MVIKVDDLPSVKRVGVNEWVVEGPGLYAGNGFFVGGSSTQTVNSIGEVQQILARNRVLVEQKPSLVDLVSQEIPGHLKQHVVEKWFGIEKHENNWRVLTGRGMIDSLTGKEFGVAGITKEYYSQAEEVFLDLVAKKIEKPSENPELVVNFKGKKIQYTDLKNYDPVVVPTNVEKEELFSHLPSRGQYGLISRMGGNVVTSMAESNWHLQYVEFIKNFLEGPGKKLGEREKITDLSNLNPRQAILLADAVTGYHANYAHKSIGTLGAWFDSESAIVLLNKSDENGVCRTFASIEKILFDALKLYQNEHNCLLNARAYELPSIIPDPHAHTVYITELADNVVDICITDPTWTSGLVNKDLDKYEDCDYALLRSVPNLSFLVNFKHGEIKDKKEVLFFEEYLIKLKKEGVNPLFGSYDGAFNVVCNLIGDLANNNNCIQEVKEYLVDFVYDQFVEHKPDALVSRNYADIFYLNLSSEKREGYLNGVFDKMVSELSDLDVPTREKQSKLELFNIISHRSSGIKDYFFNRLAAQELEVNVGGSLTKTNYLKHIFDSINESDESDAWCFSDLKYDVRRYFSKKKVFL